MNIFNNISKHPIRTGFLLLFLIVTAVSHANNIVITVGGLIYLGLIYFKVK